ncbi:hypothetical protein QQF64_012275 [Cirrhinus molitorella]|uniref:Uncharacterized protein n=1 Tax=Cirrhinus molitorella TaxID=172907 RepID=A0ABR3LUZ8_9TELE
MKSNANAKWQSLGRDTQGVFKLCSLHQGCKCEPREDTHKVSSYITKSVFLSLCCFTAPLDLPRERKRRWLSLFIFCP